MLLKPLFPNHLSDQWQTTENVEKHNRAKEQNEDIKYEIRKRETRS